MTCGAYVLAVKRVYTGRWTWNQRKWMRVPGDRLPDETEDGLANSPGQVLAFPARAGTEGPTSPSTGRWSPNAPVIS
jgi:hypothetical protein